MRPIEEIEKDAAGFSETHFRYDPPHTEDRGIGTVADYVDVPGQLMAVTDEDECEIARNLEEHLGAPIARLLNDAQDLLAEVKRYREALKEIRSCACDRTPGSLNNVLDRASIARIADDALEGYEP